MCDGGTVSYGVERGKEWEAAGRDREGLGMRVVYNVVVYNVEMR